MKETVPTWIIADVSRLLLGRVEMCIRNAQSLERRGMQGEALLMRTRCAAYKAAEEDVRVLLTRASWKDK